jgi:carbonic anhydrase
VNFDVVFNNNEKWIQKQLDLDPDYFKKLASGQAPEFLYIGCADSRVTAEELMDLHPGDVFVHRNIANMVINIDLSAMSVIEYAVKHLKVKHVVICGHYECGGVKAAMQPLDLGILNPWLRNIRDVYRLHFEELESIEDNQKRFDRLVEINVKEQCYNLIKTAVVQDAILKRNLTIHGWVFDVRTGKLIDLNVDFKGKLEKAMKVYHLS